MKNKKIGSIIVVALLLTSYFGYVEAMEVYSFFEAVLIVGPLIGISIAIILMTWFPTVSSRLFQKPISLWIKRK